ncbi:MAG: glycosyltransferase [Alphaproteobacteria bacterium]|nr:glycosyltransferase [Alphaproteobacteria bacterium]
MSERKALSMDCLWITLADPEPAVNGQLIYSQGLIAGVQAAGVQLCVVGRSRPDSPIERRDASGLAWRLADGRRLARWRRLLSPLPEVAISGYSQALADCLFQALAERAWEVIVIDSICAGWALGTILQYRALSRRSPSLVHVAHNHETMVADRIVRSATGARWLHKKIDAAKVARLERRLVFEADMITSNTPEDCRVFSAYGAGRPVTFLPPGYGGPRVAARTIDGAVPRRAVVVGSFDWPPKRISLERFLAVGAGRLAAAGIGLQFVGAAEAGYLAELRRRFPTVDFVGPVDDVRSYMASARLALVPDLLAGFKLKGLDYVFNRIPILAMRIALPGMPLRDGQSIGYFDDHEALAEGVVALIDDFGELNRRQRLAYDACAARFDWERVGRHLVGHMHRLRDGAARPATRAVSPSPTGADVRSFAKG